MKKIILCGLLGLLMAGASYGEIPKRELSSESTFKKVAYLCAYSGPSGLAMEGQNTQNTPYSWGNPRYTSDSSQSFGELQTEMQEGCAQVDLQGLCMQGGDLVSCSGIANQAWAYCNLLDQKCESGRPSSSADYNRVISW